jgi:hypothetical protein
MRPIRIITEEDLLQVKAELLQELKEIKDILSRKHGKEWLLSHEVQELLHISRSKLYELRNQGKLPYTQIGKICYHSMQDIEKMLEENKVNKRKGSN